MENNMKDLEGIKELLASSKDLPVDRVRTPIDVLNIVSAGGLRSGTTIEVYGEPKSGKSTFCYQTASLFLQDYKDSLVWIIDAESSVDISRLKTTFKMDLSRVVVEHTSSIEDSFSSIKNACDIARKHNRKILIVYDSLGSQNIKKGLDKSNEEERDMRIESVGMASRARVIKNCLQLVANDLIETNTTFLVINQVNVTGIGSYKPTITSSGGFALKHNCHYTIRFNLYRIEKDSNGVVSGVLSNVFLEKTKFCPSIGHIKSKKDTAGRLEIRIDPSVGGLIVPGWDSVFHCIGLEIFKFHHGFYWCEEADSPIGEAKVRLSKLLYQDDTSKRDISKKIRAYCLNKLVEYYRTKSLSVDADYDQRKLDIGKTENSASNKFTNFVSRVIGDKTLEGLLTSDNSVAKEENKEGDV